MNTATSLRESPVRLFHLSCLVSTGTTYYNTLMISTNVFPDCELVASSCLINLELILLFSVLIFQHELLMYFSPKAKPEVSADPYMSGHHGRQTVLTCHVHTLVPFTLYWQRDGSDITAPQPYPLVIYCS